MTPTNDAPAQASVEVDEAVLMAALLRIDAQRADIPENVRAHLLQAAKLLAALAPPQSPPQSEALIEALRKFADFKSCSPADVYRARELTGMLHLNWIDNFASPVRKTREEASLKGEPVAQAAVFTHNGRRCMNLHEVDGRLSHLPVGMHDLYAHPAPAWIANCSKCGRIIDTRERSEGGDGWGHQLSDGRWVCSPECLDAVSEPGAAHPAPVGPRGEAVAWRVRPMGDKVWHLSHEPPRMGYEVQPLYAAPATVEMLRDAIDLAIERLDTYRGSAVEEVIDLLASALAPATRGGRDERHV